MTSGSEKGCLVSDAAPFPADAYYYFLTPEGQRYESLQAGQEGTKLVFQVPSGRFSRFFKSFINVHYFQCLKFWISTISQLKRVYCATAASGQFLELFQKIEHFVTRRNSTKTIFNYLIYLGSLISSMGQQHRALAWNQIFSIFFLNNLLFGVQN